MNQNPTSGTATLTLDDLVAVFASLERAEPWRALLGKARLQVSGHLPAGNDVLVVHIGWLWSEPSGVQWLVLLDQDTLDMLRDISRVMLSSGPGWRYGAGQPAPDAELAAQLAWHAQQQWEARKEASRPCLCLGIVNLACPKHGNVS